MILFKRFVVLLFLLSLGMPGVLRAAETRPAENVSTLQETQTSETMGQPEDTAAQFGQSSVDFTWLFLKTILAMVVVLALAVIGLRFILPRLSMNRAPKGDSDLQIIERMPLDAKKSVMILGIEGRRFLVGVTEHQMSLLAELNQNETTNK